eukprot:TRINITY_DN10005_c0_g1_i3.p1 TRINITY_DN10005_c0_g1~~TRINITY_DN10005_c0_g1_i3.p1  ORF type:complete len:532 (+),score=10.42 TRINITY_DN10005_c0_g1_i3:66-1661(+)
MCIRDRLLREPLSLLEYLHARSISLMEVCEFEIVFMMVQFFEKPSKLREKLAIGSSGNQQEANHVGKNLQCDSSYSLLVGIFRTIYQTLMFSIIDQRNIEITALGANPPYVKTIDGIKQRHASDCGLSSLDNIHPHFHASNDEGPSESTRTNTGSLKKETIEESKREITTPQSELPLNTSKDKHLTLTMRKSLAPNLEGLVQYVTPKGKYPYTRMNKDMKCIIGKAMKNSMNIVDIALNQNDDRIEENHAVLDFSLAFTGSIDPTFFEFLKLVCSPRHCTSIKIPSLPTQVLWVIKKFIDQDRRLTIEDYGTKTGTYVKLAEDKTYWLQHGMRLSLACIQDIIIIQPDESTMALVYEDSLKYIDDNLRNRRGVIELRNDEYDFIRTNSRSLKGDYVSPQIDFVVIGCLNGDMITRYFILWCLRDQDQHFIFGRSSEADCVIIKAEISRLHCTIGFDHQKCSWFIKDGVPFASSTLNGTWMDSRSVDFVGGIMQKSSRKLPVQSGDLIRIGDDLLEVHIYNHFKNRSPRFLC